MTGQARISTAQSSQTAEALRNKKHYQRHGFFGEARTRIFVWYLVLMIFFVGLSIPIFYKVIFYKVDQRVQEDLAQELGVFQEFFNKQTYPEQELTAKKLDHLFQNFLAREIPKQQMYLITFLNGKFYKSSPRALPQALQQDLNLLNHWAKLTQPLKGHKETRDSNVGSIIYLAEPVTIDGEVQGVFVVAQATAKERQVAVEALTIMAGVLLGVLTLSVVLAWIISGQVLAPLRSLSQTARSIMTEENLKQRIPIRGSGELAELATTFNEIMDRLQEVLNIQRNFINDASHELRTPLTIIQGHLELFGDDPEEQQETIELVIDELERMNCFVEDLILLAKTERPDFLQLETVKVSSLTKELFAKAQTLANRNWQLEDQGKGSIVVDQQRITQAVMNLAQNATQHTIETDVIALGSAMDQSSVRFWVRDTGEGIAPKDLEHIFERFARASQRRRRSEGAGLGLAIVRAIVHAHGGYVELVSQLGTGSTFTIVLPLEPLQEISSHESYTNR
ncbi:MAG: HAMP domain-containing protein [Symploca sp. SIO2G7]|nr:HAMP domain-containing protein [Symploca sp. SIO2G7]